MSEVFLCGAGLQSCLGSSLAASVQALSGKAVQPFKVGLPGEQSRPYCLMAGGEAAASQGPGRSDWPIRAIDSVHAVVEECLGSRAAAFDGSAVFLASSSLDRGDAHQVSGQVVPLSGFALQLALAEGWPETPMIVNTACTSAFNALHQAAIQIAAGHQTEALILGVETFNPYALFGFESMQLLAPERAEPLGKDRQGMVLGEAVAALRLTSKPSLADYANPLGVWRVLAYANVVDGTNPTGATEAALLEACQSALRDSGLEGSDIHLIKLQAAGSPINDAVEMAALRRLFEVLPPCVSFKSVLGHTLGASCAAETALLLACLERGFWPQLNYVLEPDADGVVVSSDRPLAAAGVDTVLLVGLGFGGGHSVLILKRHPA
ncbi:beta-ketoacyl synthase [Hydrogenophaga sp. PAMC20947]|nr:beta-ketoacyl synthase [Hydrogenophaga sp. PAMC20947]